MRLVTHRGPMGFGTAPRRPLRLALTLAVGAASLASQPTTAGAAAADGAPTIAATMPQISLAGGAWTIDTLAGGGSPPDGVGDGGPATLARLELPPGVAGDGTNAFVAAGNRIRRVDAAGTITTLAGSDDRGFAGDGGPSALAQLDFPTDVAHDGGAVFIADRYNHRVRRVSPDGTITTVAGASLPNTMGGGPNGLYAGDGGPAILAHLSQPMGLAFDRSHNLYVVDYGNNVVRRIAAGLDGVVDGDPDELIATVAGNRSTEGGLGDGGPAVAAGLSPSDVAVDDGNNLYIVDNHKVRKVTAGEDGMADGDGDDVIATLAGTFWYGFSGDGGPATQAQLSFPTGVAVDRAGNVFIGDSENQRIRRVDTAGRISTVAGTGERSFNVSCPTPSPYCGDGGHAVSAALFRPARLDVDDDGDLLIADSRNERVRRVPTALMLMEDSPDPAKVGEPFSYTVTVGGLPAPATGVRVHVTLAPEVSFVGASASQGQCAPATGTVACTLGTLARGSTSTVRIDVRPTRAGIVESSVTLAADQSVAVPYNETVSAQTRVSAADCGQVITQSTTLTKDIGPCGGNGMVVGADNITLDLGGRHIFGFPGPVGGTSAGIRLPFRRSVTVRNGTVSDFDGGVVLSGGGSNTVTDLVLRDNIGPDRPTSDLGDGIILFESAGNTISDNQVLHNGIFDGIGVLGEFADGNRIENNLVEDTVGPRDSRASDGQGIIVNATALNTDDTRLGKLFIDSTHIEGNVVQDNAAAGISNVNSLDGSVVGNTVLDNGRTNLGGNGIGVQLGPQVEINESNMLVQGNEVHGNGWNGISIPAGHSGLSTTTPAMGNRILNNDAGCGPDDPADCVDNNTNPAVNGITGKAGFDLSDGSATCTYTPSSGETVANVWEGNTWGSAGADPACTTTPDTTAPETTITAGPSGPTDDATPTFEFTSGEWGSSFACRVDGGPFAPCTSPHTTGSLANGAHTFEVAASDPSGNADPVPALRSFNVETILDSLSAVADFDGDGDSDVSVFRPSEGTWYAQGSDQQNYGTTGDIAVPADYDGDGDTEVAVFRPADGVWYVAGGAATAWGTAGDVPVPADYDGDGKADLAVFRAGVWYVQTSGPTDDLAVAWGTTGDTAVPGDYDGDGDAEMAVFRPSDGVWYVHGGPTVAWGTSGDVPVAADYDGDASTDMAVFRPSTGAWYVEGGLATTWGTTGDIPVPGDYDGDGRAEVAVFRPANGVWFVQGGATTAWGTTGDVPLPLPAAVHRSMS